MARARHLFARIARGAWLAPIALLFCSSPMFAASGTGQEIYRDGILPSGRPLQAMREPGLPISGAAAACANCHRRSGLGMIEGRNTIPPVAGSYLFHPRAKDGDDFDLPFVEGMRADRDPYTDVTLARAIRSGVAADGHPLSVLMPHYELDDQQIASLIAYLRNLSPAATPGVTQTVLHFATIVTPDADPVARQGMLEVLQKFFEDKNHYVRAESPRLRSSRRMMFKVNRRWELHVWELTGARESWDAQLRAHLAAEPVFAVISGLGGRDWGPVHRFCNEQALPCLFPNVDLPIVAEGDFDNLYLSRGVLLEAQLMVHTLRAERGAHDARRVIQVFRSDDVGKDAANAVSGALAADHLTLVNRPLARGAHPRELAAAVRDVKSTDVLLLWLRPGDIAALGKLPSGVSTVLMSGRMGGLDNSPVPAEWRAVTRMTYPFDLPERRRIRVDYPLGWFTIRKIPVVAEQVQADTYLVCSLVSDTINRMVDTFVRDYLVERVEQTVEHRIITGYYPRLALAPGQRFASKGGYIVRFAEGPGTRVVADGGWIAP